MADEQYRWLDRETAERLLSGEPLDAVDAAARERVEQLAETLGALSAPPPLTSEELPGEAAALAAFRKVHAERGAVSAPVPGHGAGAAARIGVVRLGRRGGQERRRWGRPARLGLAAALAVGTVGGVAVAAGTGALPSPFRVDEPEPATSVSVAETEQPLVSPSPDGSAHGETTPGASPDDAAPGATGGGGRDEAGGGGQGTGRDTTPGEQERDTAAAAEQVERIASACRDIRDGKDIGVDRKRVLEGAAGSATRVWKYCEGVLAEAGGGAGEREDRDTGDGASEPDGGKGRDERGGSGEQGRKGAVEDGLGTTPGDGRRSDGAALPATSDTPTVSSTPTTVTAPAEPADTTTLDTGL